MPVSSWKCIDFLLNSSTLLISTEHDLVLVDIITYIYNAVNIAIAKLCVHHLCKHMHSSHVLTFVCFLFGFNNLTLTVYILDKCY